MFRKLLLYWHWWSDNDCPHPDWVVCIHTPYTRWVAIWGSQLQPGSTILVSAMFAIKHSTHHQRWQLTNDHIHRNVINVIFVRNLSSPILNWLFTCGFTMERNHISAVCATKRLLIQAAWPTTCELILGRSLISVACARCHSLNLATSQVIWRLTLARSVISAAFARKRLLIPPLWLFTSGRTQARNHINVSCVLNVSGSLVRSNVIYRSTLVRSLTSVVYVKNPSLTSVTWPSTLARTSVKSRHLRVVRAKNLSLIPASWQSTLKTTLMRSLITDASFLKNHGISFSTWAAAGLPCSRVCQITQGGKIEGAAFPGLFSRDFFGPNSSK